MKKSVIIIGLAALLMMSACTKKELPNYDQDLCETKPENSVTFKSPTQVENSSQAGDSSKIESTKPGSTCDIETVFDDPVFIKIMEGEIVPVKVCHGLGGECGYTQDWSEDPEMIQAYIDALRNIKIKEVITDEEEFNYVADGINDYIFLLDDDTSILISMDLSAYVIKDDKQYVFEYSKELHDLNELISAAEFEP